MVFVLFLAALVVCVVTGYSVVFALALGLVLFFIEAYRRGNSPAKTAKMAKDGVLKSKNILLMFLLIGILTGVWRACGTIPWIVVTSAGWISARFFVLSAFVLSAVMSILTGTAFGTVSTMGTVLMIIAAANGADPVQTAGAVLSGAYLGDRASPMSSSARLICECSGTDYYENIGRWVKTGAVPILLCAAGYALFGSAAGGANAAAAVEGLSGAFRLHPVLAVPAVLILLLSVFRVNVRVNMGVSAAVAAVLGMTVQGLTPAALLKSAVFGFSMQNDGAVAAMMDGGGIQSMLRAGLIVMFSSAYIGIFEQTEMLGGAKEKLAQLSEKTGLFPTTLLVGIGASAVACNQTLALLLTDELCASGYKDPHQFAEDLANSTTLVPALIPWNIACAIPLGVLGVGAGALAWGFYIWLSPLCQLVWRRFVPALPAGPAGPAEPAGSAQTERICAPCQAPAKTNG